MLKVLTCAIIAVCLFAQSLAAEEKDLTKAAETALKALLTGTPDELLAAISPELQQVARDWKEAWDTEGREWFEKLDDAERKAFEADLPDKFGKEDPADTLSIRTFEDLLKLTAAQWLALTGGQLRIQGDEVLKVGREAEWKETGRKEYEQRVTVEGERFNAAFCDIVFANDSGGLCTVTCRKFGDDWHAVDMDLKIGEEALRLSRADALVTRRVSARDAKRAEGEALLGSMHGQARIQFARDGFAPKKLADCRADEGERTGKYFRVRDQIRNGGNKQAALVAEPVDDDTLGWGIMIFKYATGEGTITWYDFEDEMTEALDKFAPKPAETPNRHHEHPFVKAVTAQMEKLDAAKAWDFAAAAVEAFKAARDNAYALQNAEDTKPADLEQAWADTIAAHYRARYAERLLLFVSGELEVDYFGIDITDPEEVALLTEAEMTDERIIRLQAAFSKIKPLSALLRAAAKDMKALRVAANVWASKDWEDKVFGDAKKLFDAAAEGKFEQDDLDFCKGPDYKPGEKRLRDAHKKE